MKNITILGGVLAILAVLGISSSAEAAGLRAEVRTSSPAPLEATATVATPPREDRRTELRAEIQTRKQEFEERKTAYASTSTENRLERNIDRVKDTIKRAEEHLLGQVERLTSIKSKIDSRLVKLETAGAVTTEARADEALAVTAINNAQAKITALSSLESGTSATTTAQIKASNDAIRKAVREAKDAIIEAQKALMKVVSDMKGLQGSVSANASSSAAVR